MNPRPALPANGRPEERLRGYAHATSGHGKKIVPHVDQTLLSAIRWTISYIEPADHLKQLVSQNLYLKAWLGNLEALATPPSRYREVVSTAIYPAISSQ